jgi:hypothetical protein
VRLLGLSALLLGLASGASFAACAPHPFTDPSRVRIGGDAVMIVVHPTSANDARLASKHGIDEAVHFAKSNRIPVIYLQDDSPEVTYFTNDCEPTYWVHSDGGELGFDIAASHLFIVGGHVELCLSVALNEALYRWSKLPARSRTVTYFMDGIYSNGKMIDPSEPFYPDFERFMGIVTYGRPGGEHWPKLTLLEAMGIIVKDERELRFLTTILPRWDRTFPDAYRVELQLNDSVKKVLRPAPGWKPPTVLFQFVDSAVSYSLLPSYVGY